MIFSVLSPATAGPVRERPTPSPDAKAQHPIVETTLRTLADLGAPERLIEQLRAAEDVDTETWVDAVGVPDVTGDGVADVIEHRLTYALTFGTGSQGDPLGIEEEFRTVFTIRDGKTGKKFWKKKYDDFVIPVALKLGAKGKRGILAIGGLLSFFGSSVDRYLTFDALKGSNGDLIWHKEYAAVQAGDFITHIAEGTPVAIASGNYVDGKATDILLSVATEVSTLLGYTMATRVLTIDGTDGSDAIHPHVDVGIDWMPYGWPAGDLDGDGLTDYTVHNDKGFDAGGPQEPITVGGTVYARKGTNGLEVWTTSGLPLYMYAFTGSVGNVAGDRAPEVGLLTVRDETPRYPTDVYLLDGNVGAVRWDREAEDFASPGDVDGDGTNDVMLTSETRSMERHRVTFTADVVDGAAKRIYKKTYEWEFTGLPCPREICFGYAGVFGGPYGDVHPNGVEETFITFYAYQEPNDNQSASLYANGKNGKVLVTGDGDMYPIEDSVDGRGDDLFYVKTKGGISEWKVLDGLTGREVLRTVVQRTGGLLPKSAYAWATSFRLPGDRCADLVVNMLSNDGSFYAILDGGSAKPLWTYWLGAKKDRPRFTGRTDSNRAC